MKTSEKTSFQWDDPLLLNQQLSEDERMVRESAAAYCQEKLGTRVVDAFRNETTDVNIFKEMGALGLLGTMIPEAYGGAGLNYVCYGLAAREVERVNPKQPIHSPVANFGKYFCLVASLPNS